MFKIVFEKDNFIRLRGRLDAAQVEKAMEVLTQLPEGTTADCSELEYISSAGIGVVVEAHKKLLAKGSGLKLVNLTPMIRNVFTYTGLHKFLLIE
jgi:anti-anti-sigma factor